MTVRGPIDPDMLGITLIHEHLFVATTRTYQPDDNTPATDWYLWEQELTMAKLEPDPGPQADQGQLVRGGRADGDR